jgi:hypothetical protein
MYTFYAIYASCVNLPHRIQQPLQNYRGGHIVDIGLALFGAQSGFDHLLIGFETRKAFVPKYNRQGREFAEISGEGSRRLAAWAFGVVHIQRQAQHDEAHFFIGGKFNEGLRVGCEFGAHYCVARGGQLSGVIGRGHADGFGSKVQGHEALVHGQSGNGGQGGIKQDGHRLVLAFFLACANNSNYEAL